MRTASSKHGRDRGQPGGQLHIECPSGLAGDMFLSACVDVGVPRELIEGLPARLGLEGVELEFTESRRGGLRGLHMRTLQDGEAVGGPLESDRLPARHVGHQHDHPRGARHLSDMLELVRSAELPDSVRSRSEELFSRLASVEAEIHGVDVEDVHFHEVGAVDSIVDIVGAALALDWLQVSRVTCGTVVVGSGMVRTEHGILSVPAPATARLLQGIPTVGGGRGELLTPTGALILASFVDSFEDQPGFTVNNVGYGLGTRELDDRPNAVCLKLGTTRIVADTGASGTGQHRDEVMIIEAQVDDVTGELLGYLLEKLLNQGALDAFFTPIVMKKGRPGVQVTVLASEGDHGRLARLLINETGSLGCRTRKSSRLIARRRIESVETTWGSVRVKIAHFEDEFLGATPEAEDCRILADRAGVTWREVFAFAAAAAGQRKWDPE